MDAKKEGRWKKLGIALWSVPLLLAGTLAIAPVSVSRPVLDDDGQPVLRADGRRMRERDHWGEFKVNWVGYTLTYGGIGVLLWGLGGWVYEGVTAGKRIRVVSDPDGR